jgi:hypothetical protein
VNSDEEARRAYLGLDGSIAKSIKLGFDGFNTGMTNIPPQTAPGDVAGTLTVNGQVDSGVSANKGMRLNIGLVDYDDGDIVVNDKGDKIHVVYNTATDIANQPYMQIMLRMIPTGDFDGYINSNTNMTGVYHMSGDMEGDLILNVTFTGRLMDCADPCITLRVEGSTHVVGTATNGDGGVYNIDLTI